MDWVIYKEDLYIESGFYMTAIKTHLIIEENENDGIREFTGCSPVYCYYHRKDNSWMIVHHSIDALQMMVPNEKILCFYRLDVPPLPKEISVTFN